MQISGQTTQQPNPVQAAKGSSNIDFLVSDANRKVPVVFKISYAVVPMLYFSGKEDIGDAMAFIQRQYGPENTEAVLLGNGCEIFWDLGKYHQAREDKSREGQAIFLEKTDDLIELGGNNSDLRIVFRGTASHNTVDYSIPDVRRQSIMFRVPNEMKATPLFFTGAESLKDIEAFIRQKWNVPDQGDIEMLVGSSIIYWDPKRYEAAQASDKAQWIKEKMRLVTTARELMVLASSQAFVQVGWKRT